MFEIKPASLPDLCAVVRNLSGETKEALNAAGIGIDDSLAAVLLGLSKMCRVVTLDGAPVAALGALPTGAEPYSAWLLALSPLPPVPASLIKAGRRHLHCMAEALGPLQTVAWEKAASHIRWVKWLGFKETGKGPMGTSGELFYRFKLEK